MLFLVGFTIKKLNDKTWIERQMSKVEMRSFLCFARFRYMVGARGKGELTTGSNHLGFRCVKAPRTNGQARAKPI